mgnify:FL=1
MVLGLVSVMSANLIETVYISFIGTEQLAALGFTFPLVMLLQSLTMGLAVGASSVVARRVGAARLDQAKIIISHSLLITLLLIVILAVAVQPNLPMIFELLGANAQAKALAVGYMEIWFLGLPFFAVAMVGSSLMRAVGDVVTPGFLMTVGAALQIILGPLFIFGFEDFSGLGVKGAAIAFVVARTIAFIFYGYYLHRDQMVAASLTGFWGSSREVFHVGLPAIVGNLIGPATMTFITRLVAEYGSPVVAGFSLAARIETMLAMVIWALSMSVAPFVGQNWGAGKRDRVRRAVFLGHVFAIGWGAVAYLALYVFSPTAIGFATDDPLVADAARTYLLVVPLGMGLMGICANAWNSFNALGQPMPPLIMSAAQMLIFTIPLALLGNHLLGFVGIFVGGLFSQVVLAVTAFFWLRRSIGGEAVTLDVVVPGEAGLARAETI